MAKDTSGPSFFDLCFEYAKKDAKKEQLTPEALAGLEEQLAASVGMSGPPGGC